MLKYVILISVLVLAVSARPQDVQVVQQTDNNDGSGNFQSLTELSDGTRIEQNGSIKNPDAPPEQQIQILEGSFQFTAPNGDVYSVTYTADDGGFRPTAKLVRSGRR